MWPRSILEWLVGVVARPRRRRSRSIRSSLAWVESLEARLCLAAGALDTSFGYQFFNWNGRNARWYGNNESNVTQFHGLLLQPDGNFLVGGNPGRPDAGIDVIRLTRYLSNGQQADPAFGDQGSTFDISVSGKSFALRPDGKILVVGDAFVKEVNQTVFGVQRLLSSGARDPSFGTGEYGQVGAVFAKLIGDHNSLGVAVQPDGKIDVLFGRPVDTSTFSQLGVIRFLADGTPDATFGSPEALTVGVTRLQPFPQGFQASGGSIAVQADGQIVIGASTAGTNSDFVLMRLNTNGTFDTTFDGDGIVTSDFGADDELSELKLQADGRIVAIGKNETSATDSRFALARYNTNGSLDATFNGDGKVTTTFAGGFARGHGLAFQADGRIIAVGGRPGPDAFAIARYRTDGSLDNTFDADGRVTLAFQLLPAFPSPIPGATAYGWEAEQVVVQPDGKLIVLGDGLQGFGIARFDGSSPGVTITPQSGLVTTEAGGTAMFTVVLDTQPTNDVTFSLTSSNTSEGMVSPESLLFTSSNWSTPQTVTVTGQDDSLRDFNQKYSIVTGTTRSGDANYNGLKPPDVSLTNDDNESLRMFRTYNPNANFHFFTTSRAQFDFAKAHGYNDESTARAGFAVLPAPQGDAQPIYRLYHLARGFHYYTISTTEKDFLVTQQSSPGVLGWRYEGIEGYMFPVDSTEPGTTTIYRLYNRDSGVHLITQDATYKNLVLALFPASWVEHSPVGRAFAFGAAAGESRQAVASRLSDQALAVVLIPSAATFETRPAVNPPPSDDRTSIAPEINSPRLDTRIATIPGESTPTPNCFRPMTVVSQANNEEPHPRRPNSQADKKPQPTNAAAFLDRLWCGFQPFEELEHSIESSI